MSERLTHLVKMANQIASNMAAAGSDDAAVQRTATHIGKFWAPSMIEALREHLLAGGEGCSPLVRRALLEQLDLPAGRAG